jgi:DNA repair protein RadC
MIVSEKKTPRSCAGALESAGCGKRSICSSEDAATLVNALLETEDEAGRDREHFYCIGLNTKNVVKYIDLVSIGSLSAAIVHPRETFRVAVMRGASAVIVAHNHPSGDTRPSQEDILLTKRLTQAGEVLGIRVLDHVIVGSGKEKFSFRDNGLISGGAA